MQTRAGPRGSAVHPRRESSSWRRFWRYGKSAVPDLKASPADTLSAIIDPPPPPKPAYRPEVYYPPPLPPKLLHLADPFYSLLALVANVQDPDIDKEHVRELLLHPRPDKYQWHLLDGARPNEDHQLRLLLHGIYYDYEGYDIIMLKRAINENRIIFHIPTQLPRGPPNAPLKPHVIQSIVHVWLDNLARQQGFVILRWDLLAGRGTEPVGWWCYWIWEEVENANLKRLVDGEAHGVVFTILDWLALKKLITEGKFGILGDPARRMSGWKAELGPLKNAAKVVESPMKDVDIPYATDYDSVEESEGEEEDWTTDIDGETPERSKKGALRAFGIPDGKGSMFSKPRINAQINNYPVRNKITNALRPRTGNTPSKTTLFKGADNYDTSSLPHSTRRSAARAKHIQVEAHVPIKVVEECGWYWDVKGDNSLSYQEPKTKAQPWSDML